MKSRHIDHRWSIVVPLRYPPLFVRPLLDIDPAEPDAVPARGVKGDVDAVKAAIFVLKQVWRGFVLNSRSVPENAVVFTVPARLSKVRSFRQSFLVKRCCFSREVQV